MYDGLYSELAGESLTAFNLRERNGEAVARLYERVASTLATR